MDQISSEQLAEGRGGIRTSTTTRTTLVLTAWLSTLLLSNLPLVIARDVLGTDIPWIFPAWIGVAVLFFASTYVWPALKPLRRYFLMMGVIVMLTFGVNPLVRQSGFWQDFVASQPGMVGVLADRVLLIVETLIILVVLFTIGVKRKDAFLQSGNLNSPVGGKPATGRRFVLTWSVLGTVLALLLGGGFFFLLASLTPGALANLSAAVPWIPLILLSAVLNAFGEEVSYRAVPVSVLLPAVGPAHALILTSLWFGLGHYYGGVPSGPFGLIGTGLLALLLGKAMLDTRGLAWPWIIHVAIDTAIYTILAIGFVTAM